MGVNKCVAWDVANAADASIIMVSEYNEASGIVTVTDIYKLPERTNYVDQVTMLEDIMHANNGAALLIDRSGCGAGPCDLATKKGMLSTEVTWTGGSKESRDGRRVNLPKEQGVMAVLLRVQNHGFKVAMFCRNKALLKQEMQEFGVRYGANGSQKFDGLGVHDDAHSALMLTAYYWSKHCEAGKRKYQILAGERRW